MEQQNQIQEIVEAAILNLRQVAEVNTIIGQPILTSMGATILPVSQVTLGFVAGGGEYGNSEKILKNSYSKQFAGGTGGGATLTAEGERLLAAYEDYCAKLTAYGETLFAETFAFYDTLTEEKPE